MAISDIGIWITWPSPTTTRTGTRNQTRTGTSTNGPPAPVRAQIVPVKNPAAT